MLNCNSMSDDGNEKSDDNKPQNYIFFNHPDIIAERAELLAVKKLRFMELQQHQQCKTSDQRLQPYPFTFMSALKQKLALEAQYEIKENNKLLDTRVDSGDGKMDFIKPLKVPYLKVGQKNTDYSPRDHVTSNKLLSRSSADESIDKSSKNPGSERVNRKLDFLSSGSLTIGDDTKQLKSPDVGFASVLSRKKSEREINIKDNKLNKIKRIKKDDDEHHVDCTKKRNAKHNIPRRSDDTGFGSGKSAKAFSERSSRQRDNKKSNASSLSSSACKNDDKNKLRSSQSKLRDRSRETDKTKITTSSESDRSKLYEYITMRNELRLHDYQASGVNGIRQHDEAKYLDNKSLKHVMMNKDQNKRINDKCKTTKNHHRYSGIYSDPATSEDIDLGTKSDSIYTELSSSKGNDKGSNNNNNSSNNIHNSSNVNVNNSSTQNTSEINSGNDKNVDITQSSDDVFLDGKKISFRDDSYAHQDEFCNLVTPDLSLVYRPKRKKDQRKVFRDTTHDEMPSQNDVPLLAPTALHMQFQAELHLFDSYNESLRQVMDVENSLYNVTHETREKLNDDGRKAADTERTIDGDDKVKSNVKVEVQTQTANDIATQTDTLLIETTNINSSNNNSLIIPRALHPGITYKRGGGGDASFDIESIDLDKLDDISLPNKVRAMSEISLHETTSSIKTETGTEISISTRDVTCSFNKFLDLEMAQLIRDEKQTYDKIEMLFRSHEKTLHDRTRKLVKLEEQKRALRDTGQDSRISSVKKKQRALLLKLQQEKDEMNRLKELHKKASQERKVMLEKQRNMLNPQMSTKNFLTKLKRSADCQSPRRLSGPMKGYDIRSNSSISSLIDSDKSHLERSNFDEKHESFEKCTDKTGDNTMGSADLSPTTHLRCRTVPQLEESSNSSRLFESPTKYQLKARKYEEKMPKCDLARLKAHRVELESKLAASQQNSPVKLFNFSSDIKSESDTLVEEFSKKAKLREEMKKIDKSTIGERRDGKKSAYNVDCKGNKRKQLGRPGFKTKTPGILTENIIKSKFNGIDDVNKYNNSNSCSKRSKVDRDFLPPEDGYASILEEINLNDSQNSLAALVKHSRAVKEKNCKLLRDITDEHEAKENIAETMIERNLEARNKNLRQNDSGDVQNQGNISTRSQVSTFTISRHSSGDSEKSYSRSVVIRSQQDHAFKTSKKLEQVLHAREAALATRRNCVEDWIGWHAKLKSEESRIIRMEEAALKLLNASSNALSCNETMASSDTSDVEGRVELLVEKLAQRRAEMAKLRKEARKQTKQKLKTLEANLLNRIKNYDISIDDMRKKLEQKRHNCLKENRKLAIEPRSISEMKIPELSKRTSGLDKSADLSRSRSESDLILSTIYSSLKAHRKLVDYESTNSLVTNEKKLSVSSSEEKDKNTSRSIESVLEEARKTLSSRSLQTSVPKNGSESVREQSSIEKSVSQSSLADKSKSSIKSAIDRTEQSAHFDQRKNDNSIISPKSHDKSGKSTPAMVDEDINSDSDVIFDNKVKLLQLNNNTLTEDINSLENDLRTLSEMVSRFNKKLDEKSLSSHSQLIETVDNSTTKDITNNYSSSEVLKTIESESKILSHSNKIDDNDKYVTTNELSLRHSTDLQSAIPSVIESDILTDEIDYQAQSKALLNVVEASIISKHNIKLTDSSNNFERSGAALEQSMLNLHKDNEALSSDFNSLEGDIKSISKMLSQITGKSNPYDIDSLVSSKIVENISIESKQLHDEIDTSRTIDSTAIGTDESVPESDMERSVSIKLTEKSISESSLQDNESEIQKSALRSLRDSMLKIDKSTVSNASMQNSDLSQAKSVIDDKSVLDTTFEHEKSVNEQTNIIDEENNDDLNWTLSDSFEPISHDINSYADKELHSVNRQPEKLTDNDKNEMEECKNDTENIQASLFIAHGESTNITTDLYDIHSEASEEATSHDVINEKSTDCLTDELDDILDIIERDTQTNGLSKSTPQALELDLKSDTKIFTTNDDLNMTVDVEPVVQRLTEILASVEDNIAKKALSKNTQRIESDNKVHVMKNFGKSNDNLIVKSIESEKISENTNDSYNEVEKSTSEIHSKCITSIEELIKDPEYEDISEESLEVSDILDRSNVKAAKSIKMPDKYEAVERTEVIRILDEISQQSLKKSKSTINDPTDLPIDMKIPVDLNVCTSNDKEVVVDELKLDENRMDKLTMLEEKLSINENEISSKISEEVDADTPRGVSEIDLDSPREQNESRFDIDVLDDDLLANDRDKIKNDTNCIDVDKNNVQIDPADVVNTEKDIEMMITKLRASLDQPGLEVVELDARLLRIEQLQIELEIKKLEAEEKTYYVREIPNKPPPPYTPPGIGSLSPESSPTLSPSIVPQNIDELTAFTERATSIIFNENQQGNDVMDLEAPAEILEYNNRDSNNEVTKRDRKIYNTFLFDLCKETISAIYQSECEKPGPCWSKPNVKTKPAIKIPKSIGELNEYVNKEVATLFGFKTKLQRENMVMRWSRKRRDRVDELLAREAQAEEDEWTKFHHDELTVKNELTVAILDTLLLDTTNVVKNVYAKKRRIMV